MSLMQSAKEILLKRRQQAQQNAYFTYQKAMSNAEIKACQQEIDTLLPEISKSEASGKADEQLNKKYSAALNSKKALMQKYDIDEKDFTPKYFCKKCNDSGYINGKVCACLKQIINTIITEQYGINSLTNYTDKKVNSNNDYKKLLEGKYAIMNKYCAHFPDTKYCTHIFWGTTGTGKTYLSCFVAKNIMKKGFSVIFVSAFKLNKIFLEYHLDFNGQYGDYIETLYDCDLLIIDDLGTENCYKNVTNEYFLSLISERLQGSKHTIITTNLGAEHLRQKYDDRFYSRLTDKNKTYIINFCGTDLRQVK
ncbi:MAG: ATP-binding protein [Clostridia bacterium]|nr:ATP-binding protein [Clostridia bacterium]